jgi:hypothetical protein
MGYIEFTDEIGEVTLSNGKDRPARRFSSWTPDVNRVADRRVALGTGITYEYLYRIDYYASFSIEHFPAASLVSFIRFKEWAMRGCEFYVYTEDDADRFYRCRIRPGSEPTAQFSERSFLEYEINIEVMSAETPPAYLACLYGSAP